MYFHKYEIGKKIVIIILWLMMRQLQLIIKLELQKLSFMKYMTGPNYKTTFTAIKFDDGEALQFS